MANPTSSSCPNPPIEVDRLVERVVDVYELQKNVVIVCAEGVVDERGQVMGSEAPRPIRPATRC